MMAVNLDSKKPKMFLRKSRLSRFKKETGRVQLSVVVGIMLVIALAVLMGAYFWGSYRVEKAQASFETKMLTCHDDILGIHRGTGGRAWAVGKNGLILHTNDGGRSWKLQASGTTQMLSAVSLADERVGFAVGSSGIILYTQDGGLSWEKQNSGIKNQLLGVQVLSETKACAVGAFGTFLSTSNGGTTWEKHKFPWEKLIPNVIKELGGTEVEPNLNAVHFITPAIGWVVGEFGLILHTRDGGQTWISQIEGGKLAQLFAVAFRDKHTGWAVGQLGRFIWTKDGGQHWFSVKHKIDKNLYAVSVEDANILVVGDRVFWASKDGGSTWEQDQSIAESLVLTGVVSMGNSPIHAIVVGEAGVMLTKVEKKVEKCIFPKY